MAENVFFDLFADYPESVKSNILAASVVSAVKNVTALSNDETKKTSQKVNTRIEDFGEKLEGAKKDAHIVYQKMLRTASHISLQVQPLSKSELLFRRYVN